MESLAEALWNSLSAAAVSPEGVAPPVAILWTDPDSQWRPLIDKLSETMPELYRLGDYRPDQRTGPAIWLKCVVERAIPEMSPAVGVIPILYLPGVARQILRAGGECPVLWQPLIELQYRGAVWQPLPRSGLGRPRAQPVADRPPTGRSATARASRLSSRQIASNETRNRVPEAPLWPHAKRRHFQNKFNAIMLRW